MDGRRDGMPAAAAWNPDGIEVAYTSAGGHLGVNGRALSVSEAKPKTDRGSGGGGRGGGRGDYSGHR